MGPRLGPDLHLFWLRLWRKGAAGRCREKDPDFLLLLLISVLVLGVVETGLYKREVGESRLPLNGGNC